MVRAMRRVSGSQVQRVTVGTRYTQQRRHTRTTTQTIRRRTTRPRGGNNLRNTIE